MIKEDNILATIKRFCLRMPEAAEPQMKIIKFGHIVQQRINTYGGMSNR